MDATALHVALNDTLPPLVDNAWHASFDELADKPQTFTVVATDAAGKATTCSVTVTLDAHGPTRSRFCRRRPAP
jgi:hypothetical protein